MTRQLIEKQCSAIIRPTAIIWVKDNDNQEHKLRAVLDSGSEIRFLTKEAHMLLLLPIEKVDVNIAGIDQIKQKKVKDR